MAKNSNNLVIIIVIAVLLVLGFIMFLANEKEPVKKKSGSPTEEIELSQAARDDLAEEVANLTQQQNVHKRGLEKKFDDMFDEQRKLDAQKRAQLEKQIEAQNKELEKMRLMQAEETEGGGLSEGKLYEMVDGIVSGKLAEGTYNKYVVDGGNYYENSEDGDRPNVDHSDDQMKIPTDDDGVVVTDADGFVVIKPMDGSAVSGVASMVGDSDYSGSLLYSAGEEVDRFAEQTSDNLDTALSGGTDKEEDGTPYMTMHIGMKGIDATAWTMLVGKIAKAGNISDPFDFTVISSGVMLGANNSTLPQIEKAVWRGVAFGDPSINCVRGDITAVTFVFDDGVVETVEGKVGDPIAKIGDPRGFPCIGGERINNLDKTLIAKVFADTLAVTGTAYADAQTETDRFSGGNQVETVVNQGDYLAGNAISGLGTAGAEYVEYMTQDIFDLVLVPAGTLVTLDIHNQIDINYGRKGSRKIFEGNHKTTERTHLD